MEEDDWIELFHASMPPLYRMVSRRLGGRRALAEDVTQETWLRAVKAWRMSGVPKDPAAWLRTVATNLIRNHYRTSAAQRLTEGADDLNEQPASSTSPGASPEQPAAAVRAHALQRALARLRPGLAALLTEHHLDGDPLQVLAKRHGLTSRAVEGRLRRGRAALARHLDPDLLDESETAL